MAHDKIRTAPLACRILIRGIVQGVGFRPFIYRVAHQHGISGWVINDTDGVEIHAEGPQRALDAFLAELRASPPPAAEIDSFQIERATVAGWQDFAIRTSHDAHQAIARISPDLAICEECLAELLRPTDRRYQYPYINCTRCGPRFSIIERLPYDRANTTMRAWQLCPACGREYTDPLDRRFHAQPTACHECGPSFELIVGDNQLASGQDAIEKTAELLRAGRIVAVKGIGGYHLACDARNSVAVAALRERKHRHEQPLAVMTAALAEAAQWIELTDIHIHLLTHAARPIVLAPSRKELPGVAPENDSLGIMLPYAPLHHLLFATGAPSPLVMTSANRSHEPIAYRDDDARRRLADIADAMLIGERPIARRVDDSVVTVRAGRPMLVRRSRGFAPGAVCRLPTNEPILALGSDLKNTVALAIAGEVLVSQHLGDLAELEALRACEETVRDLLAMYRLDPREVLVAHDLHPDFASTRLAESLGAGRRLAVQHHHAHIASVAAEHGLLSEPMIGLAFDGTGFAPGGAIWGGEVFIGSVRDGYERVAHLREVPMPGGDAAARFPVQAAAAFLYELDALPDLRQPPLAFDERYTIAAQLVAKRVRCATSTSMGRLFDAVAALVGFTREQTFEGQAAIWLECLARRATRVREYTFAGFDHRPMMQAIVADRFAGIDGDEIAAGFHRAVATAAVQCACALSEQRGLPTIALSGGVFQNALLLETMLAHFAERAPNLRVLWNERVPPNDGGIALGQAALAAMSIARS